MFSMHSFNSKLGSRNSYARYCFNTGSSESSGRGGSSGLKLIGRIRSRGRSDESYVCCECLRTDSTEQVSRMLKKFDSFEDFVKYKRMTVIRSSKAVFSGAIKVIY